MPTKKKAAKPAAVAPTSRFPVMQMRVPDSLLSQRRNSYGWDELKRKGSYKEIPRSIIDGARTSAHTYGSTHGFKVRCFAKTDADDQVITETVYLDKNSGEEVPLDAIPANLIDDEAKLAKAYTVKELPVSYVIVRITDPVKEAIAA